MYRLTDAVRHLLIINVLAFLGAFLLGDPTYNLPFSHPGFTWGRFWLGMFYPTSEFFRPYQIVTHMFMHADFGHLFFNMFGLFMFGPPIEATWGARRFLFYYLLTGFGALALFMLIQFLQINYWGAPADLINVPVLGASGAIFGILAGYAMLFPNSIIQLLIPPIPIKAKYFVLIYAGLELYLGVGGFNTGVAHFAHLGGALSGFLLILYWRKYGTNL